MPNDERQSALDRTGPDDYNFIKRMLAKALEVDYPNDFDNLDEVNWMIDRAVMNWDPGQIICILLISFKEAVKVSGKAEDVLNVLEVFSDPSRPLEDAFK